ncbi:MAG: CDP-alcohol phosphatidyltransferase family protein [Candidatus Helarchaeota archaeon]
MISFIGFLVSLIASILFFLINIWYFPIIFGSLVFIAGLLDGVDGVVARKTHKVTRFGGFFDSVLDRFSDSFLCLSFMKYFYLDIQLLFIPVYIWVFLAILGSFLVSYSRSLAETCLGDYNCDIGLGARSERLFILVVTSWFLIPYIGLIILTFVSFGTAIYRQYVYYKQMEKLENKQVNGSSG